MDIVHIRGIGLSMQRHPSLQLQRPAPGTAAPPHVAALAASVGVAARSQNTVPRSKCVAAPRLPGRLPRILCLHGSMQSGKIFEDRIKVLLRKAAKLARFVFVDAPHVHQDDAGDGSLRCWRRSGVRRGEPPPQWEEQWSQSRSVIAGKLDEALVAGDPFDGLLGFSNGTGVAAVVLAEAAAGVLELGRGASSLRFAVLCSGYRPASLSSRGALTGFSTLHVFGDGDEVISREQTDGLVGLFASPPPELHKMANVKHHVPSRVADTAVICDFLQRQHQS